MFSRLYSLCRWRSQNWCRTGISCSPCGSRDPYYKRKVKLNLKNKLGIYCFVEQLRARGLFFKGTKHVKILIHFQFEKVIIDQIWWAGLFFKRCNFRFHPINWLVYLVCAVFLLYVLNFSASEISAPAKKLHLPHFHICVHTHPVLSLVWWKGS